MSYNWTKADTAEARERLKARLDSGERIILRSRNGSLSESWLSHDRVVSNTWTRGRYLLNPLILDFLACVSHAEYEFLDPVPACPPLRWEKSEQYEAWSAEIFGNVYTVSRTPDGQYRTFGLGGRSLLFATLEEAKAACEDHWKKYWEEEMKAAKG